MKKTTILLSVLLLTTTGAHAYGPEDCYMGPGMMGWGHGMGWFMPVLMMAFLVLVIVGIVAIIHRALSRSARVKGGEHEDSALGILQRRYARGEIDKDEFEEKKKILEQ